MNMLYAIAIISIPIYARLVRASVLSVKEEDYVLAARATGSTPSRILFGGILPNCLTPIIVQGTLGLARPSWTPQRWGSSAWALNRRFLSGARC